MTVASLPPEHKVQIRTALRASGQIPEHAIDEIADIAVHAAEQGFETFYRIAMHTAPDHRVGITALGPAIGSLLMIAEAALSSLRKSAEAEGMSAYEFKLGGGQ